MVQQKGGAETNTCEIYEEKKRKEKATFKEVSYKGNMIKNFNKMPLRPHSSGKGLGGMWKFQV